jgi:hypothetical protein
LTHLAVKEEVAPSTQNQALNALLFLYGQVLESPLEGRINAVRAERGTRVPVVLTPEEARQVIAVLQGVPQLVVKLLYGSGLRVMEALRLRVQYEADRRAGLAGVMLPFALERKYPRAGGGVGVAVGVSFPECGGGSAKRHPAAASYGPGDGGQGVAGGGAAVWVGQAGDVSYVPA